MAAGRFVDVTDKEISEIKINPVPKTQKTCVKILKQLFASGSVIIEEYSPRRMCVTVESKRFVVLPPPRSYVSTAFACMFVFVVSTITLKIPNVLIRIFVRQMDVTQGHAN
jgi:hypothetical protein